MALGWLADLADIVIGGYSVYENKRALDQAESFTANVERSRAELEARGDRYAGLVEGLYEHFLGGGRASEVDLPGFSDQFGEIDESLQNQLRQLDSEIGTEQERIARFLTGGAKVRALADLAVKAQDAKGMAIREASQKKRDLDIALTNEWTQRATQYKAGPTGETQYWANQQDLQRAQEAYKTNQENIAGLAKTVRTVLGEDTKTEPVAQQRTVPVKAPVSKSSLIDLDYDEPYWYAPRKSQ